MFYIYTHSGIYTRILKKNDESLPFAAMCIELKRIMLSRVNQQEKHTEWFHLYVKYRETNLSQNQTNNKLYNSACIIEATRVEGGV